MSVCRIDALCRQSFYRGPCEENIDGISVNKWKDTFYSTIDIDNRERLFVHYDQINRLIGAGSGLSCRARPV